MSVLIRNGTICIAVVFSLAVGAALCCSVPLCAGKIDMTVISIDELMSIKMISVSKKICNLSDSAAAIVVITNDDLRTSPASTGGRMICRRV